MKNVEIVIANSNLDSFENMIKSNKVDFDDKFSSNYILVPDKYSLNAERNVLELLNINSTFNIDVVSFNRLAYRVFNKENLNIISKRKGLILVNKIMIENRDKLTTFNKLIGKSGLTENIYETIMQFKSSGILPNEVGTNDTQSHLYNKLQDIKLVYDEYEKITQCGLIDEPYRLKMLSERIKTSDLVKNSNFYIGMFDSFTYLQLSVVREIIKYAKKTVVSLSCSTVQSNKDVFINENLQQLIELCKANNLSYTIKNINNDEKTEQDVIKRNLFAIEKAKKVATNNIKIYTAESFVSEIEFIAKMIKAYVNIKNYNYKDFNLAVGGLDNVKIDVVNVFDDYDIPYYLETNDNLLTSPLIRFVSDILECYTSNFSVIKVINLTKSPFIRFDDETKQEFENYVLKYGIDYSLFFKPFFKHEDDKFYDKVEQLRTYCAELFNKICLFFKEKHYSYEFSQKLLEILDFVDYEQTVNDILSIDTSMHIAKNLASSYEKLCNLIGDIDNVFVDQIDFEVYYEMLVSMLDSDNFTNIPTSADCVYIADATGGYFYKEKVLFVANSIDGEIPKYQNDCGIITDKEITNLSSQNVLNPSIKFINKKEKNRLFNLLSTFNQKLFVTYSIANNGETNVPSEIVSQLNAMFENIMLSDTNLQKFVGAEFEEISPDIILIGNKKNAILKNLQTKSYDVITINDCLNDEHIFEKLHYKKDFNIKVPDRIKLKSSISKIEKYNKCPFSSYCQDVLGVKEKEIYGMKVTDVGIILHKVAELFVKGLIKTNYNLENLDLSKLANEYLEKAINENKSQLDISLIQKQSLLMESESLYKVICYQIKNSMFKPIETEYHFNKFKFDEDLSLSGVIDRIDDCDDYFYIIDYKTGSDKFSFSDIYLGKKLQLVVYAYIYSKLSGKNIGGFYYMPVTNKYVSNDDLFYKKYTLLGITLNNEGVIKRIDKRLVDGDSSDIIKIKYKNDGTMYLDSQSTTLDNCDLVSLIDYAIEMLKKSNKELISGKIDPLPIDGACKYCPYYAICGYDARVDGERKSQNGISKKFFKREQEE